METFHLSTLKDERIKSLIKSSVGAMKFAHNPYSNFAVGAALECEDGSVVTGCNVENVSFGLTICAERTAVCKAVSEGKKVFTSVAVSAVNKNFLVTPCGACRQFLAEFNPKITVYLHNPEAGTVGITDLGYLLPDAVIPGNMNETLNIR